MKDLYAKKSKEKSSDSALLYTNIGSPKKRNRKILRKT